MRNRKRTLTDPAMKTYLVSYTVKSPNRQTALLAYGLKLVASEYARLDDNLLLVHSRVSADRIANALLPGLGAGDELRVMEVGADVARYNAPIAWRDSGATADLVAA